MDGTPAFSYRSTYAQNGANAPFMPIRWLGRFMEFVQSSKCHILAVCIVARLTRPVAFPTVI